MRTIPLVDLEQFTKGNAAEKEAFVKKLGEAYEDIGFVAVENHGIPESLIDNFYKNVKDFFSMDTEKKKKYEIVELAGQRGYTSFGREKAKQSEVADLKEFWQIGQYVEGDDPVKDIYPENMEMILLKLTVLEVQPEFPPESDSMPAALDTPDAPASSSPSSSPIHTSTANEEDAEQRLAICEIQYGDAGHGQGEDFFVFW